MSNKQVKKQKRLQRVREKMLLKRERLIEKRKIENIEYKNQKMIQKVMYPGITIRNNNAENTNEAEFSEPDFEGIREPDGELAG